MTWNSNYSAHKVLLKHSHLTGLRISYGCVPATPAELSSCDRDHVAYKAKLFTNWVFNEKVCQLQIQPISLFASRLLLEKDVKTKFDDENSTLREIQTKWIMLRGQLGMCRDWDIPWEAGLERSFGEVRGPSMIQRAAMKKEGKNNSLLLQEIDWGLKKPFELNIKKHPNCLNCLNDKFRVTTDIPVVDVQCSECKMQWLP